MASNFIIEAWTELGLALLSIFLRLYFRYTQVGLKSMTCDDHLVILAGVFYTLETAAAHIIVTLFAGMGTNNFTQDQRAKLVPGSELWNYAVNGSKTHIFGWCMYTALVWTLKSCWTIYYSRMTNGLRKMEIRIKVAWFLNGTTYVAALCMIVFKCWPLHRQWQIYPDPGNNCYPGASKLNVTFITVLNITTDIYLMAIPLPIIYRAHLDIKRKLSLILLFSGGWIVIIFGILRCVTLVTVGPTEPSKSGQWSVRESFLAVLVSNAPMVFPLLRRWSIVAIGIVSTSRKDKKSRGSRRTAEGSHEKSGKKHRVLHPLSIPNDTAWGSDDAIVTVDKNADDVMQDTQDGIVALGVIPEASAESFASERRSQTEGKRSSTLLPGEILMVKEWTTSEGQAISGLDRREVQVEAAGSAVPVVKLEDVRRSDAII
ncbi:hypothetical protein T440DRAFT_526005 [Plenodomus tracheiphilus IPT5]|uniref:Rhodopsin domain-containing protein n=1 Tax=Plenodomus tracheiphilus IPT5 TaxID=1408161 RepID=A0A6A7BB72_9PLEO|nr:hypothetical protein T440DRAFT_526005 [Plenodomus tracheiphilus IPT5]